MKAERYADLGHLSDLIAPPYDIISPGERALLAARSPHNIVHLIVPEQDGDPYGNAARQLQQWRRDGILVPDSTPAAYVLRQDYSAPDGSRCSRTGVFLALAAEPYRLGRVRPHEHTHSGPKADRLALLEATATMLESIFVLARDKSGELRGLLAEAVSAPPLARAELAGVGLTIWRAQGKLADQIAVVAGRDPLYIADGHHRFETADAYRSRNPHAARTVALVVPVGDPGLQVLATHRLIIGPRLPESEVVAALAQDFEIDAVESASDPASLLARPGSERIAALVALPPGRVLSATIRQSARKETSASVASRLNISVVDRLIVNRLRELAGPGPQGKLGYSPDAAAVLRELREDRAAAAVLVKPTGVEEVLAVADAGEVMPPKSTYFLPKVPSGLVLLPLASVAES